MAQPYVTGPVDIWAGVGPAGVPWFLGHAERTPSIQIRPSFSPIYSDLTGQRLPLDMMYDGEEAMVSLDVTRYNEITYQRLANRAGRSVAGSTAGLDMPGEIGTIMGLEGAAFQLWMRFPYATKPAMANPANGAMPFGYRFAQAFLEGPDGLDGLGSTNRRIRLNFHCIRALNLGVRNFFGTGALVLYDFNMAAIAGLSFN